MTSIIFIRHGGRPAGFSVSGHSGYAESGQDIVCAAVSSAVSLTECQLNDVLGQNVPATVDARRARIRMEIPPQADPATYATCAGALEAFFLSMRRLSGEYPDYIRISEENKSC